MEKYVQTQVLDGREIHAFLMRWVRLLSRRGWVCCGRAVAVFVVCADGEDPVVFAQVDGGFGGVADIFDFLPVVVCGCSPEDFVSGGVGFWACFPAEGGVVCEVGGDDSCVGW